MTSGRPKITLSDLPEGWQEKIIEMSKEGASDVEIRAEALGCLCHETWTRLIKEEPIFSETVKKAKAYCNSWWERKGRVNLDSSTFSYTGWYMNMKNRFQWADKQENKDVKEFSKISATPLTDDEWEGKHGK